MPFPETRMLTGSLLHDMLTLEVESITVGGAPSGETASITEDSQRSQLSADRRVTIICDLAETLSGPRSSFSEHEILLHLAKKNIWTIVLPSVSNDQGMAAHRELLNFGPYLGYFVIDSGNPLHRKLFFNSLFDDKALNAQGLVCRCDPFDDQDDDDVYSPYFTRGPMKLDALEFDEKFPPVSETETNSERGELTANRLAGKNSGHRARVAQLLLGDTRNRLNTPYTFSARKPADGVEFILPTPKFTDYLFNLSHKSGGPKAQFFIGSLDIQPDDWRYLADQILQGVKAGSMYRLKLSSHGVSHGALVLVTGRNGKNAVIETGWRVPEQGPALFVTAYPAEEERAAGLTAQVGRVPLPGIRGNGRWSQIHGLAHAAGREAADRTVPTPFVVERYGTIWDGACGFAWIELADGRTSFARWLVEQGIAHFTRPGVRLYSKAETQSLDKKLAYAEAYGEVLRSNGMECTIGSRLD